MINFQILNMNTSTVMTVNTKLFHKGVQYFIETNEDLCSLIKNQWMKQTGCRGFKDWADNLNESGDYEDTWTIDDAISHMGSSMHVNIDERPIDVHDFYEKYSNRKYKTS